MTVKFANRAVLAISILIVAVTVSGCASFTTSNKESRTTKDVAFNDNKVMVFQSPT